ncbi:endonuclease [Candidatus Epulonipiscium fishelsonii]|uniref:Endonuclease n=1 Tax=Candidatus Epulonipiscium fishelsonii TaxID=77094 RepID=A0ACC8XEN8_9FIRM|nr:endonuclease [Epulopiscium sp. SCG-B11WGA-EpuloA1]ONI42094.1 endonuclease [Epulopiscium sp. SCG-B05WGA-EpuloA1]
MKLCYQVATPDVKVDPSVTAFQGDIEVSLNTLGELGYDGVEFMTINPKELDANKIEKLLQKNNLDVAIVCTGELFGQKKLSFTNPKEEIRNQAIEEVKGMMDFASIFGANINIGRVRGQYVDSIPRGLSYQYAIDAFRQIGEYGEKKNVSIAIEPVTYMQTNFLNTSTEAIEVCKEVGNDRVKIMLDIFHVNIEEKNIYDSIRNAVDYNIHVHLADNNRRYPGMGGLDFRKILETLKETGYNGYLCTEIYQLPNQMEAAKGTIAHLKPILESL